jgi:hypothetical protein
MKLDHAAPARELYCSPLFRAARAYVEQKYGPDRWLILSARYGLLEPDRVIEPYDVTLHRFSAVQRRVWAERVASALSARIPESTPLCLYAGRVYREAIMPFVPNPTRAPLTALRIGQQLVWYRLSSA